MFNLVLKTDRPNCRNNLPLLKTSPHQYSHVILNIPGLSYDRLLLFQLTFWYLLIDIGGMHDKSIKLHCSCDGCCTAINITVIVTQNNSKSNKRQLLKWSLLSAVLLRNRLVSHSELWPSIQKTIFWRSDTTLTVMCLSYNRVFVFW